MSATEPPSPIEVREVPPLESPGSFSTKSSPDSTTALKAREAAVRAFRPSFSPTPHDILPATGDMEGKRRLTDAFFIEIDRIRPDAEQPRRAMEDDKLHELAASVKQFGILQPIAVRFDPTDRIYRIISGERRYRAAVEAGLSEIPCWVQAPEDETILLRQVVENWQRADLHPMDLADSLARMRDEFGYSQSELAKLLGKSEAEVSRFLNLLSLNPSAQEEARRDKTGEFSRRHLSAIARMPSDAQPSVLAVVKERHLTAVETERFVRDSLKTQAGERSRGAPSATVFRYKTDHAVVTVTCRTKDASTEAVLAALREAGEQAAQGICDL